MLKKYSYRELENNGNLLLYVFKQLTTRGDYMNKCDECLYLIEFNPDKTVKSIYTLNDDEKTLHVNVFSKEIVENYYKQGYKIGINVNNPDIKQLTDIGFCSIISINKFGVLFLEKRDSDNKCSDKDLAMIEKFQNTFRNKFLFDIDDVKFIEGFLNKNFEIAGSFTSNNLDNGYEKLNLVKTKIIKGDNVSQTVMLPTAPYSFHTHPETFYKYEEHGTYSGWYSAIDIQYIINNYKNLLTHFLFTPEGIYSLSLRNSFKRYYDSLSRRDKKRVVNWLKKVFVSLELQRKTANVNNYASVNKDTIQQFVNFFRIVNTISADDLINATGIKIKPETDFQLFRLYFDFKEDLSSKQSFII